MTPQPPGRPPLARVCPSPDRGAPPCDVAAALHSVALRSDRARALPRHLYRWQRGGYRHRARKDEPAGGPAVGPTPAVLHAGGACVGGTPLQRNDPHGPPTLKRVRRRHKQTWSLPRMVSGSGGWPASISDLQ
eukprot:scaffold2261_cov405-Prasinococcus_capsulatus_cf.AAC.40